MSKKVAWTITDNNVTVCYDGETHIVKRTDKLGEQLITALKSNDLDSIPDLVSAAKKVEKFSKGNFVVKAGEIFVNGVAAPPVLGNKIVRFSEEGLPYQPLVAFAKNLQANPSYRSVQELFQFLEKNDHPITENGNFIAYKKVRPNFKDIHSGTFDNSVGVTVEMPRNQVNEDSSVTCSHGLHVANYDYAANCFGSHTDVMLEVEVNPADVVAVPADYNQAKIRVCKYKVLGLVKQEHDPNLQFRNVSNTTWDEEDEEGEVEENYCEEGEVEENYCEECDVDIEKGFNLCEDCELEFYYEEANYS